MANELKMAVIESILQLQALHWSARQIARELGIDRGTVGKHLRRARSLPKPTISPTGSGAAKPATFPPVPGTVESATEGADSTASLPEPKPAISPAGLPGTDNDPPDPLAPAGDTPDPRQATTPVLRGRPSECVPYRSIIEAKLDLELSAQRIFQDLVSDHGFTGSYDSVKRFVRRLGNKRMLPLRRIERAAGEEGQVDFGTGAPVIGPDGKRRKTYVFRIVLSHSRNLYRLSVYLYRTSVRTCTAYRSNLYRLSNSTCTAHRSLPRIMQKHNQNTAWRPALPRDARLRGLDELNCPLTTSPMRTSWKREDDQLPR